MYNSCRYNLKKGTQLMLNFNVFMFCLVGIGGSAVMSVHRRQREEQNKIIPRFKTLFCRIHPKKSVPPHSDNNEEGYYDKHAVIFSHIWDYNL